MLNLMAGLNGYTICSQVICEELNGTNCLAVPLESEENGVMEIGYVVRKDIVLSDLAKMYIAEIKKYCNSANI